MRRDPGPGRSGSHPGARGRDAGLRQESRPHNVGKVEPVLSVMSGRIASEVSRGCYISAGGPGVGSVQTRRNEGRQERFTKPRKVRRLTPLRVQRKIQRESLRGFLCGVGLG